MSDTSLKTIAVLSMNGTWRAIVNNNLKMFYNNQIRQFKIDTLIGLMNHINDKVYYSISFDEFCD